MPQPLGYVLWTGPSKFNGDPIVVIATLKTTNAKTGDMVQVWILPADQQPNEAFWGKKTSSVCGDCMHLRNQSCYVNWGQAPTNIWKTWKRGGYPDLDCEGYLLMAGRKIRFGAAGDPAMVPVYIWEELARVSSGWTGYTHQWRQPWAQNLKGLVQASCDSFQDYLDASAHGWKCFRVLRKDETRQDGEVHCQASSEMGDKTQCAKCLLCDGVSANVTINVHGARKKNYA